MKIENDAYGTCSWCKVTGSHKTLVSWRWEREDGPKTPAVCGECWVANEPHKKSKTPVQQAARQWEHLERKFAERDEVVVTF